MDKKEQKVIITDSDWRRLSFDLLISSTDNVMRSMIVEWMESLGAIDGKRKQINISDVDELATYVMLIDDYYDRRNMIIIWLKRFGIPVIGRRQIGNEDEYKRMEKKMKEIWGRGEPKYIRKDETDKEMDAIKELRQMDIKINRGEEE